MAGELETSARETSRQSQSLAWSTFVMHMTAEAFCDALNALVSIASAVTFHVRVLVVASAPDFAAVVAVHVHVPYGADALSESDFFAVNTVASQVAAAAAATISLYIS